MVTSGTTELVRADGRISLKAQFLQFALDLTRHSTCRRLKVGCVITDLELEEVLGFSYNGVGRGLPNGCRRDETGRCGCAHAEQRAATKCGMRHGLPKLVFASHQPCEACAEALLQIKGVRHVYFVHNYRLSEGLDVLRAARVPWTHVALEDLAALEQQHPRAVSP